MSYMGWRFILQSWQAGGGWATRDLDFGMNSVSIGRQLSGINSMSGTIPTEDASLLDDDGIAYFIPWASCVWAELDGAIRGGGIVKSVSFQGQTASITTAGKACYPFGQNYGDSKLFVKADPLDIVRHIYTWVQAQPNGNIGIRVDDTKSPVRIGTTLTEDTSQTPSGEITLESGPYRLSWYETDDLGDSINELSSSTPFDYVEDNAWTDSSKTAVDSFLRIGYPSLAKRPTGMNAPVFELGVNVTQAWTYDDDGDTFASDVLVRGKGEGRAAIHKVASIDLPNKLRRSVVVDEKRANSPALAQAVAQVQLANRSSAGEISSITVKDHPNAPYGSYDVGYDIQLVTPTGYRAETAQWHRIMGITYTPDGDGSAQLDLKAVEKTVRFPSAKTIILDDTLEDD